MPAATASRSNLVALSILVVAAIWFFSLAGGPAKPTVPVKSVSVEEAKALIDEGALVIDVRVLTASGPSHIPTAQLIPLEMLASYLDKLEAHKTKPIVVYCNEGNGRGPEATSMLNKAGYTQAVNLKSGIEGWRAANLPTQGS